MSPIKIGIIAGEASGDLLGADLIQALKAKNPEITFEGIAGPKMLAQGCKALFPMERLAVMGLMEPLKRLPELIHIRRQIIQHFIQNPPDVFMGIDAPDFNLTIEKKLKQKEIKTVHYVSPSVWAWRQGRIKKIKRAVDLMLCLFPFEADFYKQHQVPVKFIGHPLADQIPLETNTLKAREQLSLPKNQKILAIMPGSRAMEIKHLAEPFIQTAQWCLKQEPNFKIITAMISEKRQKQFEKILEKVAPQMPMEILVGKSHEVIASADILLLTSGTVTLEAMLLKKPMVVAYRTAKLTHFIAKRLVKLTYFALPNLIAHKKLVPEFLQDEVVPENMGPVLLKQLQDLEYTNHLIDEFKKIHQLLQQSASVKASECILKLLNA